MRGASPRLYRRAMVRVMIAGLVSTNPVILAALAGGAAIALYMATRDGGHGMRHR